jgi:NhaP-type Na+/H+ or K+/H+ antiporter
VKRNSQVPQITDARPSRAEELRYRERRYILMMSLRGVCLVAATILVREHAPLAWLWGTILVLGSLILPWLAVILANDRAPRNSHRYAGPNIEIAPQRALNSSEDAPEPRTIDHEP